MLGKVKAYLVAGQHEGEDVVAQLLLREPPPIQLYGSPPPPHHGVDMLEKGQGEGLPRGRPT